MESTLNQKNPVVCPRSDCLQRRVLAANRPKTRRHVRKRGSFIRQEDQQRVRRFECLQCQRSFSEATSSAECWQKKRLLNEPLRKLFGSGFSQRRAALVFELSRKTVARKFQFLGKRAQGEHEAWLKTRKEKGLLFSELQFDEMETFEHTQCKPLSIPLVVCKKTRMILGLGVASMPANGLLAEISRRKYGPRPDERAQVAKSLFQDLRPYLDPHARIDSDQNPKYPGWIKSHVPRACHRAFKGRKPSREGQGELRKKGGFDPLFSLNHTAAMLRANVNRLVRRTWDTTKRKDQLLLHLFLYMQFHNQTLVRGSPI